MSNWSNKLRRLMRAERGNAAIEFAFTLPWLVVLLFALLEIGWAYAQTNAIEKGIRSGALYAARNPNPTAAATLTTARNLTKTATLDGSGALLVPGWADPTAKLDIVPRNQAIDNIGNSTTVLRFEASVPYVPILPALFDALKLGPFSLRLNHEQAYIGD